jgi:NAD+ diphosphatase
MSNRCYWIMRCDQHLLVLPGSDHLFLQDDVSEFAAAGAAVPLGEWRGCSCYAVEVDRFPAVAGAEAVPLRLVHGLGGEAAFAFAGRAVQLLDWQRNHRFCGHCGTATERLAGEYAMRCPACELIVYPRISPAMMVLIRKGEKLLLARSPHFKAGVFSALAGFVEPGETVEQCVVREVREEVGLEIANLRYFASQPWPFPNSLMIAFFADYAGGQITPDPREIEVAGWYAADELPTLPDPLSLARKLIEAALASDDAVVPPRVSLVS